MVLGSCCTLFVKLVKMRDFLFNVTFINFILSNSGAQSTKVLHLNDYLFEYLEENCQIVMFSTQPELHFLDFNFSSLERVVMFPKKNSATILSRCSVLFVVLFSADTKFYSRFVAKNFAFVELVVIITTSSLNTDHRDEWKLAKEISKKEILVVDKYGNVLLKEHGKEEERCSHINPSCFLNGKVINVGYTQVLPYLQIKGWPKTVNDKKKSRFPTIILLGSRTKGHFHEVVGVEGKLLNYIVDSYGVIFNMIAPPDMLYGAKLINDTWTGKFRLLDEGEVDMLAGCVIGNYERNKIGQYSVPIYYSTFTLCSRKPEQLPNWQAPLKPFPWMVWISLYLSIVVVGPVTWGIARLHYKIIKSVQHPPSALQISIQAAATLLVEPWLKPPSGPAALIIAGWLCTCLILQCFYASTLIAYLSVPALTNPIKTLEDVFIQDINVIVSKVSTVDLFIQNSKDPHIRHIRKRQLKYIQSGKNFDLNSLDNKNTVSLREMNIFKHKVIVEGRQLSDYYISPFPILNVFVGWLFKKDHILSPAINLAILRATENGFIQKWYQDQIEQNASRMDMKYSSHDETVQLVLKSNTALSFSHVQGIFVFWMFGMSISILVFIMESTIMKKEYLHQMKLKLNNYKL